MATKITLIRRFEKSIEKLIRDHKLLSEDFEMLKKLLAQQPDIGDLIVGTGGIRKIRLKSASKGKSGGFRICYYYYVFHDEVFLIFIYQKNVKENLAETEKKMLRDIAQLIKGK